MNKKLAAAVLAAVCLTMPLTGCGGKKAAAVKAPLVKTMVIGAEMSAEKRTFSGTVRGEFESALAFQVGGRIMHRYVQSGDRVVAGQALFDVDSKDATEQAAAADASVVSARAQYELAETTMNRYKGLHEIHAISDLAMDQVKNSYDLAAAQLDAAIATKARADNNLDNTTLRADRDGIIGQTLYEVGQVIAAGTPVAYLVDDSKMEVRISLTEKQYGTYSVGMPCTVTFWALPDVSVKGIIREKAASPNSSTGTYDAKIDLIDPPKLSVGMTAEAVFDENLGRKEKISVPLTAIAGQKESPSVWVVKDGKVSLIPVKVGAYGADTVEITEGLAKGDCVVTAGGQKLHEGDEVRI